MKELKPIDYKLLFELMKDSHRSDRQIAKALVSHNQQLREEEVCLRKTTSKATL